MKWWLTTGVLVTAAILWIVSGQTASVSPKSLSGILGDVGRGEITFHVSGCGSCHVSSEASAGNTSTKETDLRLGGGKRFETEFGTFIAPNISPDKATGIGKWSTGEFATALLKGVSPQGEHYYPAFPYTSYARMTLQDVVDLKAFLDTLLPVARNNEDHQLRFPFSLRRGLGLWKKLYFNKADLVALPNPSAVLKRGQYLVEGPGHCGECHSPRGFAGALDGNRWLAGAPNLDDDGRVPNITSHRTGLAEWDIADIAEYLSSGFTPDYDVVGGSMADVVDNTAKLPDSDRHAIAAYLKAVPAVAKPQ